MTHPREAALRWIVVALSAQMPSESPRRISEIAEWVHAVAADWDVPVEECIRWIHSAEFSEQAPAWVLHCRWYAEFRRRNCRAEAALPKGWPE